MSKGENLNESEVFSFHMMLALSFSSAVEFLSLNWNSDLGLIKPCLFKLLFSIEFGNDELSACENAFGK